MGLSSAAWLDEPAGPRGRPPPPTILADITGQCERLGYRGPAGTISAFGRYE